VGLLKGGTLTSSHDMRAASSVQRVWIFFRAGRNLDQPRNTECVGTLLSPEGAEISALQDVFVSARECPNTSDLCGRRTASSAGQAMNSHTASPVP
jgi:hypothetical protein